MPFPLPSIAYLLECFDYDAELGVLRWKQRPRSHFRTEDGWRAINAKMAGKIAANSHSQGYARVQLQGRGYFAHRVAWKIVRGDDPPDRVDHRDRSTGANHVGNLRGTTHKQNIRNSRRSAANTSGMKGVSQRGSRFRAFICVDGYSIALGTFDTAEEAHAAYCEAARTHFGEFWSAG